MSKRTRNPEDGTKLALPAFGAIEPERVLAMDELFTAVSDKYPVSPGHTLIIPRRAVTRFQELNKTERAALVEWIVWVEQYLQRTLSPSPDGFNLGLNDGPAAGQTIPQVHFHVIPRYGGDMSDPRGGVRWVKPDKAKYW
jgi:diadenosine tetraphosphate (Ap4A) HIT family hydrolase